MNRPPEVLKSFANRMAHVALSDDAVQMLRLMRLSGFLKGPNQHSDQPLGGDVVTDVFGGSPDKPLQWNPGNVGIWERKIENGKVSFVRSRETMKEWHLWANVGRIEAKGTKTRVLLLGESVARGYLYDPEYNPASVLQTILESHFGSEIEVIDVARTSLHFEISEVALGALQLEPDIAIIFAGNNWSVTEPQPSEIAEIDEALSKEGITGIKRIMEEQIARKGRRVVNDIASAYESHGVPLIWMVPEYDLVDWRDPFTNAPYLAENANVEWLMLLDQARQALREGDIYSAKERALRMLEIDHGVTVAALYILADCSHQLNDVESERKYLELARDATIWDSTRAGMPRCYSVTQELIRTEARRHKNQLIDVPGLFKEHLQGELPGRRLFLDYCHMSSEGIQVAMAAAASEVIRTLTQVETPWQMLMGDHLVPSREIEAEASFLAAIHHGHWWQSYEIVRHYCSRALSMSAHVTDLMLDYIELQTRYSVPMRMSESEDRMLTLGSPLIRRYFLGTNSKRLDKVLLDAIADALAEAGIDGRQRLDHVRCEEHSVRFAETNLLDYYYASSGNQSPQEVAWMVWTQQYKGRLSYEGEYHRALWPESIFVFVSEAGCPVRLSLTCRLPRSGLNDGVISIVLNGRPQVETLIGKGWSSWEIEFPGETVRDGLNEVSVNWPIPQFSSRAELEKATVNLCTGRFPDFYPIFGEIHSFTASQGQQVLSNVPVVQEEAAVELA
ncbi:MAG TPA: hypothetical protein VFY60_11090 [Pyrinomonadaceae bacterium]|nr:hypothetical protein [Pyrinomonadaceae bacterium]